MKLIALLTLTLLVSCGKDESMKIIHNNDRVTMLEARMQLAESNFLLTNSRIDALDMRVTVLESDLVSLQSASEAADAQLQADIDALSAETAQSITNILIQISSLNETDEDLQEQVNDLANQLDSAIESLNDDVSDLSDSLSSTQSQLNQVKNRVAALELSQFVQNVLIAGLTAAIGDLYNQLDEVQDNQSALASQVSNLAGQVSALANQVNNLPESLTEAQIQDMINNSIQPLQNDIAALQTQTSGPQLQFVAVVSRQNGQNNNASVTVKFKNISSVTVSKFKVTFQTNGDAETRSGSSMSNGNVTDRTDNSVTFQNTNSGISPNSEVTVTILLDDLNGSDILNFTTEVL